MTFLIFKTFFGFLLPIGWKFNFLSNHIDKSCSWPENLCVIVWAWPGRHQGGSCPHPLCTLLHLELGAWPLYCSWGLSIPWLATLQCYLYSYLRHLCLDVTFPFLAFSLSSSSSSTAGSIKRHESFLWGSLNSDTTLPSVFIYLTFHWCIMP